MNPERWREIERVYNLAREQPANRRPTFLEQICGEDHELRREVESLLAHAEGTEEYVNAAALAVGAETWDPPPHIPAGMPGESEGTVIGRYCLLQKIGEGGMGEVWLAEQREPVRRRVALKLVKAGMNTREVIARFESERQALALMDHPAIAKVFDAGSTPQGAPYFVMEYVAGVPITTYCDSHRLSTRERLELFTHVCEGVQHAHQKAIIHRDLKPSNILVMELDGRAAPKIIDFGVAKALTQKLTADTMFTRVGALVGTPEYMSPEQASSSGEDIDTRTDVYSLGIIFYELLAGAPPIELHKIAFEEFLRRLREDEPPKPSIKVRTQDPATSTEVARKRRTEPLALAKQMRGDLDSIALKALEKERLHRYGSPADFAADIGRYLKNEAVLAVPPSAAYRARKFARRYRGVLAVVAAFVLVLTLATGVSTWQSIRATRQRDRADAEAAVAQAVNDFLQNDLLAQASAATQSGPSAKPDPDLKVRTALDRAAVRISGKFARQPEVEAAIRDTIGQAYIDLGLYSEAEKQLERARDLHRRVLGAENPKTLKTNSSIGYIAYLQGRASQAEVLLRQTVEIQRRVLGPEHPDTLETINNLATVYQLLDRHAEAEVLYKETLETRRRVLGPDHPDTLRSMNDLAAVYASRSEYGQAEALFSQLSEIQRRVLGSEHPRTLSTMDNLGETYFLHGKYSQAEALLGQTLEVQRRVLGPEHPDWLSTMSNLGETYYLQGKYLQAEALLNQALEAQRRVAGPEHFDTIATLASIADMYQRQGKYALAERYAAQALAARRHAFGSENPDTIDAAAELAMAFLLQGKFTASEPLAREAVQFDRKQMPDDWQRFFAESLLGATLAAQRKYADAEALLLAGYQGLAERKDRIAAPDWYHLDRARDWIVQLYQASGKPNEAATWRTK